MKTTRLQLIQLVENWKLKLRSAIVVLVLDLDMIRNDAERTGFEKVEKRRPKIQKERE